MSPLFNPPGTVTAATVTYTPGTGMSATDAQAALDELATEKLSADILTTRGDLIRRSATAPERVALGAAGQVLASDGTDAAWGNPSYSLYVQTLSWSPADALTYYLGAWNVLAPATSEGSRYMRALRAGKVRSAHIAWLGLTASGSSENISVYVRNVTAGTEALVATVGNTAQVKSFANYAMTLAVSEGEQIEVKVVCPTWVTNPTGVQITGHIMMGP